jgi:hypothetical protein
MVANAFVNRRERGLVRDRKRKVVQADIGLAVEGHGVVGIGDAPNGEGDTAVGDEHGRIRVIPGYFLETESSTEEARGLVEIANGKTDVVHAVGQSVGQNSILSSWVMIEGRLMDVPSEEVRHQRGNPGNGLEGRRFVNRNAKRSAGFCAFSISG